MISPSFPGAWKVISKILEHGLTILNHHIPLPSASRYWSLTVPYLSANANQHYLPTQGGVCSWMVFVKINQITDTHRSVCDGCEISTHLQAILFSCLYLSWSYIHIITYFIMFVNYILEIFLWQRAMDSNHTAINSTPLSRRVCNLYTLPSMNIL